MLDQQPSPPRPPDPSSSSRHRPKPKPPPKKLPQRGLGVAQLEKLRLEEEHSKQEAAWNRFQHHHAQLLPSHDAFPLLSDLLASSRAAQNRPIGPNCFPHTNSPLPFLAQQEEKSFWSHGASLPGLPLAIPPSNSMQGQRLPLPDVSFPPMSVCPPNSSPNATRLVLQPQFGMHQQESQRETDDLYPKAQNSGPKGMPSAANAQNEGTHIPFTDLRLLHPHDALLTARNRLESPVVSIASTGAQARELSSFQTFPVSSAWSPAEQVFSRKRPWVLNQEPARNLEPFKNVDLNTVADEIDLESTERNSPGTGFSSTSSAFRDGWRYSSPPMLNSGYISSTLTQDKTRLLSLNRPCTDCASVPESLPAKMYMVSSALKPEYLSTSPRKGSLDHDASYKQEAETCGGEFLTLGPSTCLNRAHGNRSLGTGSHSYGHSCSETKKDQNSYESASFWQPHQSFSEQAKNLGKSTVARVINSDVLMSTAEDVPNEDNCIPLQINVELPTCWTKGHRSHVPKRASVEGSLDLELRLSL